MALQSLDVTRRSASTSPAPGVRETTKVAKLIDVSKCIGCKACQVACMEWNDIRDDVGRNLGVYDNPIDLTDRSWTVMRFYEEELPGKGLQWLIVKDGCLHCEDPGCLRACPAPGAIVQFANGIVDFQQENCIGCGYCISGCPFNVPKLSSQTKKVYKCTLCVDRVSVGLEPACIKACPTSCLKFGTKEALLIQANKRVDQLKASGFATAGVYDPGGVGGTGVVTVLAFADKPEAYGLPAHPSVPFAVTLWKQPLKWLGSLAMIGGIIGTTLHYLRFGAKHVREDQPQRTAAPVGK
jgi:formate dehydrogenase iron-sulfur subunit